MTWRDWLHLGSGADEEVRRDAHWIAMSRIDAKRREVDDWKYDPAALRERIVHGGRCPIEERPVVARIRPIPPHSHEGGEG